MSKNRDRARELCGCHYCEGPYCEADWLNNYDMCTAKEMLQEMVDAQKAGRSEMAAEVQALVDRRDAQLDSGRESTILSHMLVSDLRALLAKLQALEDK